MVAYGGEEKMLGVCTGPGAITMRERKRVKLECTILEGRRKKRPH